MGMTTDAPRWTEHRAYELARKAWNPKLHPRDPMGRFFDGPDFGDDGDGPARSGGRGNPSLDRDIEAFRKKVGYDQVDSMLTDLDETWHPQAVSGKFHGVDEGSALYRAAKFDNEYMKSMDEFNKSLDEGDFPQTYHIAQIANDAANYVWPGAVHEFEEAMNEDSTFDHLIEMLEGMHGQAVQDNPQYYGPVIRQAVAKYVRNKRAR